jgi:RNA polymerase sigma-70 factor (ECF subfamily)
MAALVVLDELSTEQRVAFVLHDAFGVPFGRIAEILSCSPDAARQHASRARKAVADAKPPSRMDLAEQRAVLTRFLTALAEGDMAGMVALLHPDVVVVGDGGGKARTALRPVTGPDKVTRFAMGLLRRYGTAALGSSRLALVNGDIGLVVPTRIEGDAEHSALDPRVTALTIQDGLIVGFYDVANPDKLRHVVS